MERVRNESKLLEREYELIYPRDFRSSILCGSPKAYKSKFCSILSAIRTSTYKLARFLVPILSLVTVDEFSVHDSFSFADEVSCFCHAHCITSLDVESLFTNIPLNGVTDTCIDDFFCDTNTIYHNDMRELSTLAKSCTDELMVFQWCSNVFPLVSILANAFLCHFEKQWLSECASDVLSNFFKRYVDDIFVMFLCQPHLNDFMNYMNTKHTNIKFTSEFEKNDIFAFLDVKITRSNNQLVTSIFCRATFSGAFINF